MQLNRANLIQSLCDVCEPSLSKKREWDTSYRNKTVTYWNNMLWEKILEDKTVFGEAIDKYEFYNFCGYLCSTDQSRKLFDMINQKSRSISLNEFEDFLDKLDNVDYDNIMKSLEPYPKKVAPIVKEFNVEEESRQKHKSAFKLNDQLINQEINDFFNKQIAEFEKLEQIEENLLEEEILEDISRDITVQDEEGEEEKEGEELVKEEEEKEEELAKEKDLAKEVIDEIIESVLKENANSIMERNEEIDIGLESNDLSFFGKILNKIKSFFF